MRKHVLVLLVGGMLLGAASAWGQPDGATRDDGARRLTDPPAGASDQNPAFSPDGAALIFTRFENGYNDGPAAIYRLNLDGGELTLVTAAPDSDSVNLPGSSWNPVTDRIAFSSDREDTDDVWTMDSAGEDLVRVTFHAEGTYALEPSFSPDGEWIVFEVGGGADGEERSTIWKVRADGSELTRLTDDPAFDDRQPNWSPVDDVILFQRRALDGDNWDLFVMDADGDDIQPVAASEAEETDASWSPDGEWIVYSTEAEDLPRPNLFVIPVEGGEPVRVTQDERAYDGAPSWSPDGAWIAFESGAESDEEPTALWIIAAPDVLEAD